MGKALQVVSGRATNPAAITALTVNTGDSFTVRSTDMQANIWLTEVWAQQATAGLVRIRSPRLHDQAQGIRLRAIASSPQPLTPPDTHQRLYSQDNLTFEQQGGGAETDLASFLVYYENLPGIDANLHTYDELRDRIVNIVGVERAITTGATAGDYGGAGALNATFDTLKRNVDYALLGYLTDTAVGTIGLFGPDTGNVRVGGPGSTRSDITADWFVELSRRLGLPCIPVINAANVANTTTDVAATQTATAINVTYIMAELAGSFS